MLSRRSVGILFISCVLLFAACARAEDEDETRPNLKNGDVLSDSQAESLPDTSDPEQAKFLKCGICQNSVLEMVYNILKQETDEGRKLKEVEIIEIIEHTCSKSMNEYGLLLDDKGNPTNAWSNDVNRLKAKGGWVTRLAMSVCSDVSNDYENYLVQEAPKTCFIEGNKKTCRTQDLVRHVCQDGLKWCKKGLIPTTVKTEEDGPAVEL